MCNVQLAHPFYCKHLGRKVITFISYCAVCQRVKHPKLTLEQVVINRLPVRSTGFGLLWNNNDSNCVGFGWCKMHTGMSGLVF